MDDYLKEELLERISLLEDELSRTKDEVLDTISMYNDVLDENASLLFYKDKYLNDYTDIQYSCDQIYTQLSITQLSKDNEKAFDNIVHILRDISQTHYFDSRELNNLSLK